MIPPEKLTEWEALCGGEVLGNWSACNISNLLIVRAVLPEAIAEIRRLHKDGSPVRCTQCLSLEGQEHGPLCYRKGIVSIASDYRFEGRSMKALQEQLKDNQRLQAEVERLRAEVAALRKPADIGSSGA